MNIKDKFLNLGKVEAIFCDIDGTLIDSNSKLNPKTIEAVKKCPVPFFLVSGRSYNGMKVFHKELSLDTPILSINGNIFFKDGKPIYKGSSLQGRIVEEIYQPLLDEYSDSISLEAYDDYNWYCNTRNNEFVQYEERVLEFPPDVLFSKAKDISSIPMGKLLIIAKPKICDDIIERFSHLKDQCQIIRNHDTYIEFYALNTNKGLGALKACEMFSLNPNNCVGCGDSAVDLPLLKSLGFRVAVDNADSIIKDVSNIITGSNNDCGIAELIEEIIRCKNK